MTCVSDDWQLQIPLLASFGLRNVSVYSFLETVSHSPEIRVFVDVLEFLHLGNERIQIEKRILAMRNLGRLRPVDRLVALVSNHRDVVVDVPLDQFNSLEPKNKMTYSASLNILASAMSFFSAG